MPALPSSSSPTSAAGAFTSKFEPSDSSSANSSPDSSRHEFHSPPRARDPQEKHFSDLLLDSPSRQLPIYFSQLMVQSDRDFNHRLDTAAAERTKLLQGELAKAKEIRDRIQASARLEQERLILEEECRRLEQEEMQRREVERLRQEKAKQEAELRARLLEDKRKQLEESMKQAEQAKELAELERKLEAQRREADERERQAKAAKEAAAAAEKARLDNEKAQQADVASRAAVPSSQPKPSTSTTTTSGLGASPLTSTPEEREAVHRQYLDLHQRLKQLRKKVADLPKGHSDKTTLGDARRALRMAVGQIATDKQRNRDAANRIRQQFKVASNLNGPMEDIRQYIVSRSVPTLPNESDYAFPTYVLYLVNHFAKNIVNQFVSEESGKLLDWIGLLGASIFADQQYWWNGISLVDIFIAKYHKTCPVLFGIYGRENTVQGKQRLGWRQYDGNFDDVSDHHKRMRALGAGYAAFTLRSFSKTPAWPPSMAWRSLACIINVPATELTDTHLNVLNGLVRDNPGKFLQQYGSFAKSALLMAVVDIPARTPKSLSNSADKLRVLVEVWKKELKFTLN